MSRRTVATALVGLVVLTGGCGVHHPGRGPGPIPAKEFVVDLERAPTPAQVAIPAGQTTVSYGRTGRSMLDILVRLPGGTGFRTAAFSYDASYGLGLHAGETYFAVGVHRTEATSATGEAVLLGQADLLGLDKEGIQAFVASARHPSSPLPGDTEHEVFTARRFGYVGIDAEMRIDTTDDSVVINYSFTWTAQGSPPTAIP